MKIVALDISGNFKEGKGTTGIAELIDGEVRCISSLSAKHHSSPEEYWHEVIRDTIFRQPNVVVIEGYMLYNHKGMNASTQANSDLETPQLLGALKHYLYLQKIPMHIQYAKDIKTRWSEKILVHMGILTEKSTSNKSKLYLFKNQITSTHERDAMKHALRFWHHVYEKGKWLA